MQFSHCLCLRRKFDKHDRNAVVVQVSASTHTAWSKRHVCPCLTCARSERLRVVPTSLCCPHHRPLPGLFPAHPRNPTPAATAPNTPLPRSLLHQPALPPHPSNPDHLTLRRQPRLSDPPVPVSADTLDPPKPLQLLSRRIKPPRDLGLCVARRDHMVQPTRTPAVAVSAADGSAVGPGLG